MKKKLCVRLFSLWCIIFLWLLLWPSNAMAGWQNVYMNVNDTNPASTNDSLVKVTMHAELNGTNNPKKGDYNVARYRVWLDDDAEPTTGYDKNGWIYMDDYTHDVVTVIIYVNLKKIAGSRKVNVRISTNGAAYTTNVLTRTIDLSWPADKFKAELYKDKTLTTLDRIFSVDKIDFSWPNGTGPQIGSPTVQNVASYIYDNFSLRLTKDVAFGEGDYRFYLRNDDGTDLWVNGVKIINDWAGAHGEVTPYNFTATSTFAAAGSYPVKVEYNEGGVDAGCKLWWDPPPTGSLNINSGAVWAGAAPVTLNLSATDTNTEGGGAYTVNAAGITHYQATEDKLTPGADIAATGATPYTANKSFTLSGGAGLKTVHVRYKDASGSYGPWYSKSITVDLTPPDAFDLLTPLNNEWVNTSVPTFTWSGSDDHQSGMHLTEPYQFFIDATAKEYLTTNTYVTDVTSGLVARYCFDCNADDQCGTNNCSWS